MTMIITTTRFSSLRSFFPSLLFLGLTLGLTMAPFLATDSMAQTPEMVRKSLDKTAITKVLMTQQAAWNRADLEAFMAGYLKSEKLRFASGKKITYGWKKTLAGYKKRYSTKEKMGKLTFTLIEINLFTPETATVFGRFHLKRTKDELGGLFTLVFKKTKEGWKIISDHTSGD